MSADLCLLPAHEVAERVAAHDLSPVELVDAFLSRIEGPGAELNAFITVLADEAREKARELETVKKSTGPLHGVPIAVKDLFDVRAGTRNTFGCKLFEGFVPEVTAPHIERLEAAGAILIGKTNTPEFGHKGTTDNLLIGPTSTPFGRGKNSGGSSGGSAAAVAAGLVSAAHGSDGGGSIRVPAAMCGTYGLKPSFGRIPNLARPNAFLHSPFISNGPLTRTVADAALLLNVMAGFHEGDPFSLPDYAGDFVDATTRGIEGMRIAYSPRLDLWPVSRDVADVIEEAVGAFRDAGAIVDEVELGIPGTHTELCEVWLREAAVLYAELNETFMLGGVVDFLGADSAGIPPQFADMIRSGQPISAVQAKLDDAVRTQVFDALMGCFASYDLLVSPTTAIASIDNGSDGNTIGPAEVEGEAVDPLMGWCLTYPFNMTGHPAASIPAGFTGDGMPVGMQLIGRRHDEASVLAASGAFEQARPWAHSYDTLEVG